ncbi:sodium:calcium antiporter [Entomomonas moraniae]|uniref:Sodium:calcium antiporter n=1 Tax=Entomomonas moraniae TaxID=2213226 RepID=A0A3Q9JNP4_9GAMM|nr:sodium:calcium antiporter [Entomomonas moraniae]AZS51172.1 sodium:calcium antiporter [Entomomonas moraniae]
MLLTFTLFLLSAWAIYFSCEYFVNGIEWLGRRLRLGATAVGSVLAAFGTALPESVVTFMAVVFGNTPEQKNLGIGAAMGGPLVLATLAYAIVGLVLIFNRKRLRRNSYQLSVDHARISRDQGTFLAIFVVKVALGLIVFSFKPWLGILFLLAYAIYVWREIKDADTSSDEEALEPLKICPSTANPSLALACLQTLLSLLVIGFASHQFVIQLESIAIALHWQPTLVAVLLSPVATELPEMMNALIWVRQGKERLALANISGAMMIQATIPSALGIFFTPWKFDGLLLTSGIITMLAIAFLWQIFRRGIVDCRALVWVSSLYAIFVAMVVIYF